MILSTSAPLVLWAASPACLELLEGGEDLLVVVLEHHDGVVRHGGLLRVVGWDAPTYPDRRRT